MISNRTSGTPDFLLTWLFSTTSHQVTLRDAHVRKIVHAFCFELTVEHRWLLLLEDVKGDIGHIIDVRQTRNSF